MTKSTLLLIPICIFFLACISKKKNIIHLKSNNSCEFCKNIKPFDYPYRGVSKSTRDSTIIDSIHILTSFELKDMEERIFCFLGKSKTEIDQYIDSNIVTTRFRNGHLEQFSYIFNRGNYYYYNDNYSRIIKVDDLDKYEKIALFPIDIYSIIMFFTEKNGELIYTGTKKDSMQLMDCIRDKR